MTIISIKQKPYRQKERRAAKKAMARKNPFRKLIAAMSALLIFAALSANALAAGITAETAKRIALEDAGYTAYDVTCIRAKPEADDGIRIWEVEFRVEEDGGYKEYEYELAEADGRILNRDVDYENDYEDVYESRVEGLINAIIAWILSLFR